MAAKGAVIAMTKLLNELKQGQKEFKNTFESSLANLKTELLQAMDDKIEAVNTEIKGRIDTLDKKFLELEKRVKDVEEYCKTKTEEGAAITEEESVQHLSEVTDRQAQLKRLEYRTLDQEARGRRNNVLIFQFRGGG